MLHVQMICLNLALPGLKKALSYKRPLPTMPPTKRVLQISNKDYGNMYYGKWDCETTKPQELSFKAGDIIHVIEKKYEDRGWLTAILDGKVGLVPKDFLTPAYERA